jgi:hypothetical protein
VELRGFQGNGVWNVKPVPLFWLEFFEGVCDLFVQLCAMVGCVQETLLPVLLIGVYHPLWSVGLPFIWSLVVTDLVW